MSFNLQVYVTMYLNDVQRTAFYEGIGLNTRDFDMHVIVEVIVINNCGETFLPLCAIEDVNRYIILVVKYF